jgi:hypothetical protein
MTRHFILWSMLLCAGPLCADTISQVHEDTSIAAPTIIDASSYQNAEGAFAGVQLTWIAVPEAVSYHLYRQIQITQQLDESGGLVSLDEPQMAFVPWGTVDAVPGESTVRAIVSTLDNVATRWGIAAGFERDGQRIRSPISTYEIPVGTPTATATTTWGSIKTRAR